MERKKVIVACGGAVATSTLIGADLIVTTSKVKRDYGIPLITGMPFISGVGVEKTEKAILDVLKGQ